jgi:hypothetical protein
MSRFYCIVPFPDLNFYFFLIIGTNILKALILTSHPVALLGLIKDHRVNIAKGGSISLKTNQYHC